MAVQIDTTLMPRVDPTSTNPLRDEDRIHAAEIARLLAGRQPRFHLPVRQQRLAEAMEGDREAAAAICMRLHDYQRLFWARWLFDMNAPMEMWHAALEVGLTQQHDNRAIEPMQLFTMLKTLRKRRGLGLPMLLAETFTIYRGGNKNGFSWTLDRDVAIDADAGHRAWYGESEGVHEMQVTRDQVLFYTDSRQEKEVLINFVQLNIPVRWPDDALSRRPVLSLPNELIAA